MICYLNPAYRLLSKGQAQIVIANGPKGSEIGYLPSGGASRQTLEQLAGQASVPQELQFARNLYAASKELLKGFPCGGPSDRCELVFGAPVEAEPLRQLLEQIARHNAPVVRICVQAHVGPAQAQQTLAWMESLSGLRADTSLWAGTELKLQPQIVCTSGWDSSLASLLEQFVSRFQAEPAVLFPRELFHADEPPAAETRLLELLDESGYSCPFRFATVDCFDSPRAWQIARQALRTGSAGYVELAHELSADESANADFRQHYGSRYRAFARRWLADDQLPPMGLADMPRLWNWLVHGSPHVIKLSWPGAAPSSDLLSRLGRWCMQTRPGPGLGGADPSLVPAGLWPHKLGSAPDALLEAFFETCEAQLEVLTEQLFFECSDTMEENQPVWLDLSAGDPVYHTREWRSSRSVTCLDEGVK